MHGKSDTMVFLVAVQSIPEKSSAAVTSGILQHNSRATLIVVDEI